MTIKSSDERYRINPNVVTVIVAVFFVLALGYGIYYFNSPRSRSLDLVSQAKRNIEDRDYEEGVSKLKEAYLLSPLYEEAHLKINDQLVVILDKADKYDDQTAKLRLAEAVAGFDVYEPVFKDAMSRAEDMADRAKRRIASCDNIEKAEKYLENGDYDEAAKEYETAVRNGGLEEDLEPKMSLNTAYLTIRDMCIDADREGVVEFIDSVSFNAVKDELKKDDSIRLSSDRYLSIRDRNGIDMVIYGSLKNGRTGSAAAMISASNVNAIYEGEFSRGVPGGMGKLIIWDKSEGADKAVILTGDLKKGMWEGEVSALKDGGYNKGVNVEEIRDYAAGVPGFGGDDSMPSDSIFDKAEETDGEGEDPKEKAPEEEEAEDDAFFGPDVFDAMIWPIENTSFSFLGEGLKPGTLSAGTPARIIAEKDDSFYVHVGEKYGLVKKDACLINLPDIMQREMIFDIKNAYECIYKAGEKRIPEVTGESFYTYASLGHDRYLAPLLYPAALKLYNAEEHALGSGQTIKVYDAYQPSTVTKDIHEKTDEAMKEDEEISSAISEEGRNLSGYIPKEGSDHNYGTAIDVTLVDLVTGEEIGMQTAMHDISQRSSSDNNTGDAIQLALFMEEAGFEKNDLMWWHYTVKDLKKKQGAFQTQPFSDLAGTGYVKMEEDDNH